MSNPVVYMMIGVPASGKSTIARDVFGVKGIKIFSTDNIIEALANSLFTTYDALFQNNIKMAEKLMLEWINDSIRKGESFIWDQTNLTKASRGKKLTLFKDTDYIKIACYVKTPEKSVHNYRLNNRDGKTIPSNVIASMINNLEEPSWDEGFNQIMYFDGNTGLMTSWV